jgi:hypothetical protein
LKLAERKVFDLVVRENVHLQPIDVPLLMGFARASAGLFKTDNATDFEKLARVAMSFATKLRITPQSRCHPLTLARANRNAHSVSYYDRTPIEDDLR